MKIGKITVPQALPPILLLTAGLLARLLAANINLTFENDLYSFQSWAVLLHENGLPGFYGSGFSDYPPVYMYVLYVMGGIKSLFGFELLSPGFNILIKAPAMLCDLALGFGLYRLASNKLSPKAAVLLTAAWLFNPAVILDSAVWGQVDSFYTLIMFLSLYLLSRKKYLFSYLVYGVAVLTKPQSIFIGPVFLYDAFMWLKEQRFSPRAFGRFGLRLLAAGGLMLALSLPFTQNFNFMPILGQYVGTLGSYSYATVNAYNFFALIGGNWRELGETLLALPYYLWGAVFLVIIVAASLVYLRIKRNIWYAAAALNILVFMFSVKMHERYIYPALFFLLIAYVVSRNKQEYIKTKQVEISEQVSDARYLFLYGAFSLTFFVNCVDVLRMLAAGNSLDVIKDSLPLYSFINVALAVYTVYVAVKAPMKKTILPAQTGNTAEPPPLSRKDVIFLLALITVYAAVAFFRLGDTQAPQTTWRPAMDGYALVDFGEEVQIDRVRFMMGARHDRPFVMYASTDGVTWPFTHEIKEAAVFTWSELPVKMSARYFEILPNCEELLIQEAAFIGEDGALIPVPYVNEDAAALFDEQALVPDNPDFMSGTYFDEIYHARTGYEFANGLWPYENTHPPLGKDLIALSIKIFGMTPFGWRFPGTLFGVLMIPLLYAFARYMFRSNNWALFCAFLFTFDFMHFAQTRIATIDTYVTFFVIAMYLFMYRYTQKRSLKTLLACGVCMGLAIASKWQGIYGAVGLPLLFLPQWFKLLKENRRTAFVTAGWCCLFFIGIPVLIYALSYIPFALSSGAKDFGGYAQSVIGNQVTMWSYHSNLESEHPFSSAWWQWPLMMRPIYYYSGAVSEGIRTGISSFGNPIIWWTGIIATAYALWRVFKTRDYNLIFLLAAYAAQYIPWVLVPRTTYIYHYFPSVPFVVMLIAYMFKVDSRNKKAAFAYAGIVLVVFILFYPVLSAMPIYELYVRSMLRWLPGWVLI